VSGESLRSSSGIWSSGTSTRVILDTMSLILNPMKWNLAQLSDSLQRNYSVGAVRVRTYSTVISLPFDSILIIKVNIGQNMSYQKQASHECLIIYC
jgi:hypothetical protein